METAFQRYWNNLKSTDPEAYKERLRVNRERVQRFRKAIYSDPAKHEAYKKRMREKYKTKVAAAKKLKTEDGRLPTG